MKVRNLTSDMIDAADKACHQSVWLSDSKEAFVFITWCPETMRKAEEALRDAGVLCDTTVGHVPQLEKAV